MRGKFLYIEFFHKNCKMSPLFIFFQFTSKIESKFENFNLGGLGLKITSSTHSGSSCLNVRRKKKWRKRRDMKFRPIKIWRRQRKIYIQVDDAKLNHPFSPVSNLTYIFHLNC